MSPDVHLINALASLTWIERYTLPQLTRKPPREATSSLNELGVAGVTVSDDS